MDVDCIGFGAGLEHAVPQARGGCHLEEIALHILSMLGWSRRNRCLRRYLHLAIDPKAGFAVIDMPAHDVRATAQLREARNITQCSPAPRLRDLIDHQEETS